MIIKRVLATPFLHRSTARFTPLVTALKDAGRVVAVTPPCASFHRGNPITFTRNAVTTTCTGCLLSTNVRIWKRSEPCSIHSYKTYCTSPPHSSVESVSFDGEGRVAVLWESGQTSLYPSVWLRDNCQCNECYSHGSIARKFLMDNLENRPKLQDASVTRVGNLRVEWKDGHVGEFYGLWLHGRKFEKQERETYKNLFELPKVFWSPGFTPQHYDYSALMEQDETLFQFLSEVEQNATALVKKVPCRPQAALDLTIRLGGVQETHYGKFSNVEVQDDPENVSYSNLTLNLHNDLPQYKYQPGIIFLHMLKQHRGPGGDTTISDGLRAAEELKLSHPDEFNLLTNRKIYFLAKGFDTNFDGTVREFFKINKEPVIKLDAEGNIVSTHFNNQGRESHMDQQVDEVERFYDALLLFFRLLKKHSINLRLEDGDLAVIDNERCQHGRLGFQGSSERHLVTTYMSWDEARCKRRRLQEKFCGKIV